jgi:hypothetical protein
VDATWTGRYLDGCGALLASPHLAGLRQLHLPYNVATDAVAALVSGPVRPARLVAEVRGDALAMLVRAGMLTNVLTYYSGATDDLLIATAALPSIDLKDGLTLHEGRVTARGFEALGHHLDQLPKLALTLTPFTTEIAAVLIRHMPSANLRHLQHSGGGDTAGLDLFISSPAFAGVETLDLEYGPFNEPALLASRYRGNLRRLCLGWGKPMSAPVIPGVTVEIHDEGW